MRKLGSAEKVSGSRRDGAAIPSCITRHGRRRFHPSGMPTDLSHAVSISTWVPPELPAVTFIVLGLALWTSWWTGDSRPDLELQEQKLQRSEAYLRKLSKAQSHRELRLEPVHRRDHLVRETFESSNSIER